MGVSVEKIGVKVVEKEGRLLERGMSLREAGVEDGMHIEIIEIGS